MAPAYGTIKRGKSPSPSSSGAIKAAIAASPHANLLQPPSAEEIETARRAPFYDEVRALFDEGLMGHEILERYPEERHWMQDKMSDWETVYRREQIQFIEGRDKPQPTFTKPAALSVVDSDYLPLPELEVDKPHMKAVAIIATIWRSDTGEGVEETVWFPRSQIKDGKASKWIVDKKREELEAKYPVQSIDNFPQ